MPKVLNIIGVCWLCPVIRLAGLVGGSELDSVCAGCVGGPCAGFGVLAVRRFWPGAISRPRGREEFRLGCRLLHVSAISLPC